METRVFLGLLLNQVTDELKAAKGGRTKELLRTVILEVKCASSGS